jgi:hypothetical protein
MNDSIYLCISFEYYKNAFLLVNPEMTCFVYTATPQEKQKWTETLNKVRARTAHARCTRA